MMAAHQRRYSLIRALAEHDAAIYRAFECTLRSLGHDPAGKRVLDIGCGANAPLSLLLHAAGSNVTGIDSSVGHRWGLGFRPDRYLRYAREVGILRTVRKAVGEFVYDRRYYATLADATGLSLTERRLDLRQMPAERLRFEAASFDIIHSNATWEHLADVRAANREVTRVLRPRGIAYIEIHLFPSLSGGHNLPWIVPGTTELGGVTPWQHLRDPGWKPTVYLTKLREQDYRRLFQETPGLEILEWKTEFTEGEGLLTETILEELSDYTREELTKRSIIAVLRRSNNG